MPIIFNPSQLGIWNFMNLILSYSSHAQLGLMHGLNKAIPLSKGDELEETKIRNSIFWLNLALSTVASVSVFLFSFFIENSYKFPLRILSIIFFLQMLYYYYYSLLRAKAKFILISNGILFTSTLTTFLVLALSYLFLDPIMGALIGLGLSIFIVLIYWHVKSNYVFKFNFNLKTIKKCFIMGLPILAIGLLDSFAVSIDRMFIAINLSETQLGYYALGIMMSGILSIIPGSVASVLYTSMLERYSLNEDPKDVRNLLLGPMRVLWTLMIIIIAIILIILPLLIQLYLPKYIESISTVQILIIGSFFMSASYLPGQFLIAVNKQKLIIVIQLIICIIVSIVDYFCIHYGYGFLGVAIGTITGYSIYGIGYTSIALNLIFDDKKEILKYLFWLILPLLTLFLTFMFVNCLFNFLPNEKPQLLFSIIKLIIVLFATLLSVWIVNKDGVVFHFFKNEYKKVQTKLYQSFSFK